MKKLKLNLKPLLYRLRHDWLTTQHMVGLVAIILAISWILSALSAIQQNYILQKQVNERERQKILIALERDNLAFENEYYKSLEYQELALRERLGLAMPGEKKLVLGKPSEWVKQKDLELATHSDPPAPEPSNLRQWLNFLFGARNKPN